MLFVLAATVGVVLYLAPLLIALQLHRRDVANIGALNILLGWTVVGWFVACVWAIAPDAPLMATPQHR